MCSRAIDFDVSIHAFRGEGDATGAVVARGVSVSIHAFRGEGDQAAIRFSVRGYSFNPRLPGGRRPIRRANDKRKPIVSIHAFRGEGDLAHYLHHGQVICFNPRLPGGRRPDMVVVEQLITQVSIHAFRGEGDTGKIYGRMLQFLVSIHAFRGEGDSIEPVTVTIVNGFNPRLPGGRRRARWRRHCAACAFQSTPSGGKATHHVSCTHQHECFNPRLPGGRRHAIRVLPDRSAPFQSTPSGGKATRDFGR